MEHLSQLKDESIKIKLRGCGDVLVVLLSS